MRGGPVIVRCQQGGDSGIGLHSAHTPGGTNVSRGTFTLERVNLSRSVEPCRGGAMRRWSHAAVEQDRISQVSSRPTRATPDLDVPRETSLWLGLVAEAGTDNLIPPPHRLKWTRSRTALPAPRVRVPARGLRTEACRQERSPLPALPSPDEKSSVQSQADFQA